MLVPDGFSVAGVHTSDDNAKGTTNGMEAVAELDPKVALMVAVWLEVKVPAAAVNPAVLAPDAMPTEAGTAKAVVLDDRPTVTLLEAA